MKKYILLFITIASMALGLTSCGKDFLQIDPEHSYRAEDYYSSDKALQALTEPLYNRAWFNYNRRAMLGMGSQRANDGWNPYVSAEFARFNLTGLTEDLSLAWSALYVAVTMSNAILHDIDNYKTADVSEAAVNAAKGEALLMRGAAYFYLLRGWGDVILFENNDDAVSIPVRPLNTEESVLEFIVRDFEDASELLPETGSNKHACRYAAKAMLAKALLAQSGWNKNGTRDAAILDRVIELCDDVINNGPYELLDDYENLFRPQYNDNAETILAMRWAKPSTGEWGSMNALFSDLAFSETTDVRVWGGSLVASPDMIDCYNEEPGDSLRLRGAFFSPGRYYSYIRADEGGYTYKHNWMQCKKGVVGKTSDCDGELAQMASPLNTYIMRLADIYLTKAEAIMSKEIGAQSFDTYTCTNAEALAAFNATRLRAKIDPKTSFTFYDLIRERRVEFAMEYANWYDMVTWYRWRPTEMLKFFNINQFRAYEIRENDIILNEDGTLSYFITSINDSWEPFTYWEWDEEKQESVQYFYWNDALRDKDDNIVKDKAHGYTYDLNTLTRDNFGVKPVILTEENIFMPYPESDILQNPYFRQEPQPYDFNQREQYVK